MPPTPVAAPWYGSIADGWLCDSIADIDSPRVFARSLQDLGPLGWQLAQQRFRGLVGAVLTPQRAEHPELQIIRVASQGANDGTVLILLEGHGVEVGLSY